SPQCRDMVALGLPTRLSRDHGIFVQRGRRRAPGHARPAGEHMSDPLLSVEDLQTHFHTPDGTVKAVDGARFEVDRGETVCLVGESGSGKTVACESINKLFPTPPGELVDGRIVFDGTDLAARSSADLADVRGGRIAHVFQNPQGALDQ